MTEADWLACADPKPMLEFLKGKTSERKVRLLLCGCCRRIWHLLQELAMRNAIEVSEQHADNEEFNDQVKSYRAASLPLKGAIERIAFAGLPPPEWQIRQLLIQVALGPLSDPGSVKLSALGASEILAMAAESAAIAATVQEPQLPQLECYQRGQYVVNAGQGELIREVFGNPFRPVSLDHSWLTSDVIALAPGIYQDHAFDRLPILADALQDAGCDNEDVLNHCRQPGDHVRGCWVVDLIHGKV